MSEQFFGKVLCAGCGEVHENPPIEYVDPDMMGGATIFCPVLLEWAKPVWEDDAEKVITEEFLFKYVAMPENKINTPKFVMVQKHLKCRCGFVPQDEGDAMYLVYDYLQEQEWKCGKCYRRHTEGRSVG